MSFLKSTWGVVIFALIAVCFVGIQMVRKLVARHHKDVASETAAPSTQADDARQAEGLSAYKESQRKIRSEDNEDGVNRAHYAPPDRNEGIKGPNEGKEPPPPPYVPMRLRSAKLIEKIPSDVKAEKTDIAKEGVTKNDSTAEEPAKALDLSKGFAPYGRLLKCELLLTLESTSDETPIVGLVTDDLYWNGKLIIPANSEVHGKAKIDRVRDRAFSDSQWVVVMSEDKHRIDGEELVIKAIALDREDTDGSGKTWGITDGSYGLKGEVIRTDDLKTVEAFAAAAIAAGATSLQTQNQSLLGNSVQATPRNAALAGSAEVMHQLQKQILDEIQRNGAYLRVPAGKQFYLYIQETLFPAEAKIAANLK